MAKQNVLEMSFERIYPLYIAKAEKKGRTKQEVDRIIYWLTGYTEQTIQREQSIEDFFKHAPQINPNAVKIKGMICGHRVEEITDQRMQQMRWLDKLIDELAKGKPMEKILR